VVVEDTDCGVEGERLVGPLAVLGEVRCDQPVLVVKRTELGQLHWPGESGAVNERYRAPVRCSPNVRGLVDGGCH
jgi:hypothetical protein